MNTVYVATAGDTSEVLAVFTSLDLVHHSHEFSNHKRTDIESWDHQELYSTVHYKDGTSCTVNIQRCTVFDQVEHL